MKNTSYEERKKCCLKELLGQTPSQQPHPSNVEAIKPHKKETLPTIANPPATCLFTQVASALNNAPTAQYNAAQYIY
jgi:hypothetical protein